MPWKQSQSIAQGQRGSVIRRRTVLAMLLAVAATVTIAAAARANGGKAKQQILLGQRGNVQLEAEIDSMLFAAASLSGKYKVLRIRIVNRGDRALRLSAQRDRVSVGIGERSVAAILDLATADASVWDGLPQRLREAAAYPAAVEAREEHSLIVFVPDASLTAVPDRITYTVASESSPFELEVPRAAD
jgi:hypothetical protein